MNTEQLRAELLPCPFCGRSVSFHQDDEECRDGCHYIECKTCGTFDLSTAADPTNTVEDLGELRARITPLWNRRAALQSQDREGIIRAARAAMNESFEVGDEYGSIGIPSDRAAYLSLLLDEYDHARRAEGGGE